MNFTNHKLNDRARKPLTFENWQDFREEFMREPVLPACYDLPSFADQIDFRLRLPIELGLRVYSSIRRGTLFNFSLAIELSSQWLERLEKSELITINEFLDAFPMFILK